MYHAPKTIDALLKRNVLDFSDREALAAVSYRTGKWVYHTWKEIDDISSKLAAGFQEIGIEKGHKVSFMLTNNVECYYTYLAVHKIGAIFIPINVRLVSREIEYIVENSEAVHAIVGQEFLHQINEIRNRLDLRNILCVEKEGQSLPKGTTTFSELLMMNRSPKPISITPEDTADIIYTSGTTGLPKGVVLTQANKVACGRLLGASIDLSRLHYGVPTFQTVFPISTSSGCSSTMMQWLFYGIRIIHEEAFDPVKTLETIQKEKSTIYAGAPAMFAFLLSHPHFKDYDTTSIRKLVSGAAAMPKEMIRNLQEAWQNVKIYNIYALTEAGTGGTTLNATDVLRKIGSIGHPWAPDQEMRIVDENGNDLGIGEVGEIILRGPNIMKEYYKNPDATANTLKNGWLHTGDMGYYDDEGYLYFTDRLKDMIVRGGFNIYSVEVENAVHEHPSVKQCAVIGKSHPKLGEDVVAFVVLKEGKHIRAEDLNNFVKDKLADYKRPRDIRFVNNLPLNPTGKVDKKKIKTEYL